MFMKQKILIVGGVAGGASAAARLRRLDEYADIIIFERGEYISFANCGLPYYIGGEIKEKEALILQTPQSFHERFNINVRVLSEVISINRSEKKVTVKNLQTGETYDESYDKMILSPGAQPIVPNIEGIDSNRVFTLRNIPDTYKIKDFIERDAPKSAVIVGGGYIGIEMAENLRKAGLSVSVVELSNQVIAPIDYDMACEVHRYLEQKGVKLYLENGLNKIEETAQGLLMVLSDGTITADMVILAVGVRPEGEIAKTAALEVSGRGAIIVNEHMQTSDEHIYAVGDAVEVVDFVTGRKAMIPLAGPANKQGRIAADNICGIGSTYEGTQGSAILKVFEMTVAATGINEKAARALNLNYDKSFTYSGSHAGYYPGGTDMLIKTIFEKQNGKVLGCQIVGFDGVDKRCDVLAVAIRAGMTADHLSKLELCYAPPYSSAKDPVNLVGYVVDNIISGKVKIFHWHDIGELQKRSDVFLLDIRTVMEYEDSHIDGSVNIPLDSLRKRIREIPKDKPVYAICQIGFRGYLACRILSQNGYDAYNLSGGFQLYHTIEKYR